MDNKDLHSSACKQGIGVNGLESKCSNIVIVYMIHKTKCKSCSDCRCTSSWIQHAYTGLRVIQ